MEVGYGRVLAFTSGCRTCLIDLPIAGPRPGAAEPGQSHPNSDPPDHREGGLTLSRDLAIDLRDRHTLVYAKGRGIVLKRADRHRSRQPDQHRAQHAAGGVADDRAHARLHRGGTALRKGAITDFDITQRMIELLLKRAGISRFGRPARADLRPVSHYRRRA